MVFSVITHVAHSEIEGKYYAYMPYVREMNLWIQDVNEVYIVCPLNSKNVSPNSIAYDHSKIRLYKLIEFDRVTIKGLFMSLFAIPINTIKIFLIMIKSDHIHLRCPSNIGILGVVIQILFPFKKKTAKYAGNWGESKGQPWSYRFQKWILRNTFLTHNMQVLVYGEWPNQTRNILPFFTASYAAHEIVEWKPRSLAGVMRLVFVGTLISSKNPLRSIQVAEILRQRGFQIQLDVLGDGPERNKLEAYIQAGQLRDCVYLRGNVSGEAVKRVLQEAHFLVFLSNSEGWPKAVAEAMFWGCVPLTKPVSCVPWMLSGGTRGILAESSSPEEVVAQLLNVWGDPVRYQAMSAAGAEWAHHYTLEKFQDAIRTLL